MLEDETHPELLEPDVFIDISDLENRVKTSIFILNGEASTGEYKAPLEGYYFLYLLLP